MSVFVWEGSGREGAKKRKREGGRKGEMEEGREGGGGGREGQGEGMCARVHTERSCACTRGERGSEACTLTRTYPILSSLFLSLLFLPQSSALPFPPSLPPPLTSSLPHSLPDAHT